MNRIEYLNNLAQSNVQFNLGAGTPPLELYPKFDINNYLEIFKSNNSSDVLNYHKTSGIITELASETLKLNEGINCPSAEIILTNGTQEAIALACNVFKNKTIACLDPYYPGIVDTARMVGGKLKIIPEDRMFEELDKLESGSLFYICADFSNPTGKTLTIDQRKEIITIAERRNLYVFDDATYREINLLEKTDTLYSMNQERVIHSMSFSKILSPGLRTAFVFLPKLLTSKFLAAKANISINNSGIGQAIIGGWLLENNFQISDHLTLLKSRLKKNQSVLREYDCVYSGGFFTTLNINIKISFDWCHDILEKQSIAVCPMRMFSDSKSYESSIRLAIANLNETDLRKSINLIINYL